MAHGDRAALDVQLIPLLVSESQHACRVNNLAGESLVDLDEVEIGEGHPRSLEELSRGREGADPHDAGVNANGHRMAEGHHGLVSQLLRLLLGHHEENASTVA